MKLKTLITVGIILGALACLVVIVFPAAPLWQRLGLQPVCIQGNWPDIRLVSCPQDSLPVSAVTPIPLPTLGEEGPFPIIIDDDGSPDGTIAMLYFLRNPLFDIRAVTVSYGEAHPEVFARHVAQLLAGLGRVDIPVGAGREIPLEGDNAFPDPWRQGSDQFWGLQLEQAVARVPSPAAELIVQTVSTSNQPVTVFVSGSHTNLAEALRLEPSIAQNIRDVFVMGGAIHVEGNIEADWPSIHNRAAEWNIWVDPFAASEVFGARLPLHLVPLDATRQVTWTRADLPGWTASGSEEGALAGKLLQSMLDFFGTDEVYIWDLVAAVQATNPAICPETRLAMDIVIAPGPEQGSTLITNDEPNTDVCLEPDAAQVKALAAAILGGE